MTRLYTVLLSALGTFASQSIAQLTALQPAVTAHCVTTMTITYSRLPTPPYWPQCSFDGTERVYTATTTATRAVDCHGCDQVAVSAWPKVHCPAKVITTSVTEATPLTIRETVCAASRR